MKRIIALLLAFSMIFVLGSCGGSIETEGSTEQKVAETTDTTETMNKKESDITTSAVSETETETETIIENDIETEKVTTEEPKTETATETESEFVSETESLTASETETETFSKTERETETESESETETETEVSFVLDATMKGDRPVLFVTDEMLSAAKEKALAMEEPWYSAMKAIESRADAFLNQGAAPYTGESATAYRLAACKDFIGTRYLALAYLYTNDVKYLDGAVEVLMSYAKPMLGTDKHLVYSRSNGTDGKPDIGLNIAAPLTAACDVYSLLYPYIESSNKTVIERWIKAEAKVCMEGHAYWIENDYYGKQYGNNHLTSHMMGIIAAAYVLEDDGMLEYVLTSVKNDMDLFKLIDHAILMEGDEVYSADIDSNFVSGEIYDRYRSLEGHNNGFGYSMYHLKFLTHSALMLYHNGIDLFNYYGEGGENLLLPFLTYSEYLIQNDITLGSGHYSNDKSLNRENAYSTYSIAYYIYKDETVKRVLEAMDEDGVVCNEIEMLGITAPYLFGIFE